MIPVEYNGTMTFILVQHMTKENVYNYQCLEISDRNTCYHFLLEGELCWITTGMSYVDVNQIHDEMNTYNNVSSDLMPTQISSIF